MERKVDRRQAKTKQQLVEALLQCIENKGLKHVTVTDIAKQANINRGTFYLHYQDVSHMLQQLMSERIAVISRHFELVDPLEHREYAEMNLPYPKIVQLLEFINNDRYFFKTVLGANGNPAYKDQIKTLLKTLLQSKFEISISQDIKAPVPSHYLLEYMGSASIGMIVYWVENDLPETPVEIATMIMNISNYGLIVSSGLREKK